MTLEFFRTAVNSIPPDFDGARVMFLTASDFEHVDAIQCFKRGNMDPNYPIILLVELAGLPEDHFQPDLEFC